MVCCAYSGTVFRDQLIRLFDVMDLEDKMLFFVVDDEPFALKASGEVVKEAYPDAEVMLFDSAKAAVAAITEKGQYPDFVMSDIEMPGVNGLDFAVQLKRLSPRSRIIFVTGYSQYALDACRIHIHGYILKPMTVDRVREECEQVAQTAQPAQINTPATGDKLKVKCFGYFEVFWQGRPLMFARRQTKELFAYLIDRRGDACSSEEIAAAIWEDEDNIKNLKARVRILISDLRKAMEEIGKEDIIVRRSGRIAILPDKLDCDYYRMLSGDMAAVNAYQGEYMIQYSWAELTSAKLMFKSGSNAY